MTCWWNSSIFHQPTLIIFFVSPSLPFCFALAFVARVPTLLLVDFKFWQFFHSHFSIINTPFPLRASRLIWNLQCEKDGDDIAYIKYKLHDRQQRKTSHFTPRSLDLRRETTTCRRAPGSWLKRPKVFNVNKRWEERWKFKKRVVSCGDDGI